MTVVIFGFFAFIWFGWGQSNAPAGLVIPLVIGTALGAVLAVTGIVLTRRASGRLSATSDPDVGRRYGIIVGLEFGVLAAGAAALGVSGYGRWIPVWICAGVGVHFFPLAGTLANPTLRPLGVLLVLVAVAALAAGLATAVAPSTVTGLGAGLCLLLFGAATALAKTKKNIV